MQQKLKNIFTHSATIKVTRKILDKKLIQNELFAKCLFLGHINKFQIDGLDFLSKNNMDILLH